MQFIRTSLGPAEDDCLMGTLSTQESHEELELPIAIDGAVELLDGIRDFA